MSDRITTKRRRAIQVLLDSDGPVQLKEALARADISEGTLMRWLAEPAFQRALRSAAEARADSMLPAVWAALTRAALDGNVSAIKLFLDRRHTPDGAPDGASQDLLSRQNALILRLLSTPDAAEQQ